MITSITLSSQLREFCFPRVLSLKTIIISDDNQYFKKYGKYIVNRSSINQSDFNSLVFCDKSIKSVIIPNFITKIGVYAFYYCTQLQKTDFTIDTKLQIIDKSAFSKTLINNITIPKSVTLIGRCAFYECKQLQRIEIPNDSKLEIIDEFAFNGTLIESIVIPKNVIEIGKCAFGKCIKLKIIEINDDSNIKQISKNFFTDSGNFILMISHKLIHIIEL